MKTEEKTEEKKPILNDAERKREVISFQVSPQEKTQITYMAIKDRGISVSEFIRTRIFAEPKKVDSNESVISNPLDDEERTIYEEKIKNITKENTVLKDHLILNSAVKDIILEETKKTEEENIGINDETDLIIKLDPKLKQLFDRAKQYREDQCRSLDPEKQKEYYDFNKFLNVLLLKGIKHGYSRLNLKSDTGLILSDFTTQILDIVGVKDSEI